MSGSNAPNATNIKLSLKNLPKKTATPICPAGNIVTNLVIFNIESILFLTFLKSTQPFYFLFAQRTAKKVIKNAAFTIPAARNTLSSPNLSDIGPNIRGDTNCPTNPKVPR